MLEAVDLKKKLSKPAYAERMPQLQEKLAQLQYAVAGAEMPVVICLEGWNASGRGRVIRKLTEKLDPRLFRVHAGLPPSEFEQGYHFLWRHQIELPNRGEMALFDHSWYRRVLEERCEKIVRKKHWREAYDQINQFERWLTDDGQLVLKFWMHISKKEQKERFQEYRRDPLQRWKLTREYRRQHRRYRLWTAAVEEMLAKTNAPSAPWKVIEATDLRWARVRIFEILISAIGQGLARRKKLPAAKPQALKPVLVRTKVPARRAAKQIAVGPGAKSRAARA